MEDGPAGPLPGRASLAAERVRAMADLAEPALGPVELPGEDGTRRSDPGSRRPGAGDRPGTIPISPPPPSSPPCSRAMRCCSSPRRRRCSPASVSPRRWRKRDARRAVRQPVPRSRRHRCFAARPDRPAAFTGSVEGGRAVERAAAGATHPDPRAGRQGPAYVRADADVSAAVEGLADGAFYNSGQSCCAVERLYVHEAVWQPFLDGLVAAAQSYRLGTLDPETSLGPMASAAGAAKVRSQVADARAAGAVAHVEPQLFRADTGDLPI